MEIILHIGAHRTATTTFQAYLRDNRAALAGLGVAAWEPHVTRKGLLSGVMPVAGAAAADEQMRRARARIGRGIETLAAQGMRQLLVSDENMIGTPRHNRRRGALYPDIGGRMQRFSEAFGHGVGRVVLSIRPQDEFWSSVLIYSVMRGHRVPGAAELAALARAGHGWREPITVLARALPGVEIRVLPHHPYAGRPDLRLARMIAQPLHEAPMLPPVTDVEPLNASAELPRLRRLASARGRKPARLPGGEGRWSPFDLAQLCRLREIYSRDIAWLRAGADGLATLIEEEGPCRAGTNPAAGSLTRGHADDIEERRLA